MTLKSLLHEWRFPGTILHCCMNLWKKNKTSALHWFHNSQNLVYSLYYYKCVHQMGPSARYLKLKHILTKGRGNLHLFGKNYNLLFLLPFCSLLFLLFIWIWPPKASELQTIHCIVRNVVDILHGCWAEDVHLCLGGFGTRGPLFGCFWTPSLLGGPRTVGPWFPGFGGHGGRCQGHFQ